MTHGFQRRQIDRDGVRLSYLDNDAAGPAIVLLHGLAGTGDEFFATAEAVGGPYRFILPDLRGHGASTRRPADLSRAAFVDDVAAMLRHVSPGRPVMLAGQSMGGHTAILAAAALPELIDRLVVLEATVAGGFDPRPLGNWFRSWPLRMPVTVVFAAKGKATPEEQAEFVAARPGTRHILLSSGSHDAHLDATEEWAKILHTALT